jgi:molecular chaperone GrpE
MTDSHSRKGPGGTTGARDGAGGLEAAARAAQQSTVEADVAGDASNPLPLDPTPEYVAMGDHDGVVEQLTNERDAMRNDRQRIAADFENYKRRAAREREQASAAAESRLLGELLTVIDDTERAIEHAGQDETTKEAVTDGLRTVHSRLNAVVSVHGLERVDASVGSTFDPNLHEAMMVQAGPNGEADDTILQELQSGWKLGERVLRHARVIVAGGG